MSKLEKFFQIPRHNTTRLDVSESLFNGALERWEFLGFFGRQIHGVRLTAFATNAQMVRLRR